MIIDKETLDMDHYIYSVESWEDGVLLDKQEVNEYCKNDEEFKAVVKMWSDDGYSFVNADHNLSEEKARQLTSLALLVDLYDEDESATSCDPIYVPYKATVKDTIKAIAKELHCRQKDVYVDADKKSMLRDLSEVVFTALGKYDVEYL